MSDNLMLRLDKNATFDQFACKSTLTHFKPLVSFYIPREHQKCSCFLMFQWIQKETSGIRWVTNERNFIEKLSFSYLVLDSVLRWFYSRDKTVIRSNLRVAQHGRFKTNPLYFQFLDFRLSQIPQNELSMTFCSPKLSLES